MKMKIPRSTTPTLHPALGTASLLPQPALGPGRLNCVDLLSVPCWVQPMQSPAEDQEKQGEWGWDTPYLSTTSLMGWLCPLTFWGTPQHTLSISGFWYQSFPIPLGPGKPTSSLLSLAHTCVKSLFIRLSSNDPEWLGHPFPAGSLTGTPNKPMFSLVLSLNHWFTLHISALCSAHSRLPLVQLNSQMEMELPLFSVALFLPTYKIPCSTWKKNVSQMA